MIKNSGNIFQAKSEIDNLKKEQVEVTVNLGRNKFVKFIGMLEGVYPALFTVTPVNKDFKGKTTYSYSEYLCGKVKLKKVE